MDVKRDLQYKHLSKSSVIFSYCYNDNRNKAQEVKFDNSTKKCYLRIQTSCHSSNHLYYCEFIAEFNENYSFDLNKKFQGIAYFGESKCGHAFILQQSSEKKFNSERMIIYEPVLSSKSNYLVHVEINFPLDSDIIINSMINLFSQEIYSDVKLMVDDKIFNVHKSILSSRNEVLAKMIEDMIKKETDTISLPGWDPVVVEELLKFIYTGNCNITYVPHDLFKLSHFLQIIELQNLCEDYLVNNTNIKNLINSMDLINNSQYNLTELEKVVKKVIKKNESALSKDLDFIDYLSNSINSNNATFVLEFSNNYNIKNLLSAAVKYICCNNKEVLNKTELRNFLTTNPTLLLDVFERSFDENFRSNKKVRI